MDLSHLEAIEDRLRRERARLDAATTSNERKFRQREIGFAERELAAEHKFLGIPPLTETEQQMTADEILDELNS